MALKKIILNTEVIKLPTKLSDLENDSGFITADDVDIPDTSAFPLKNYGACTTASASTTKAATLTHGSIVLVQGEKVSIKFSYAHTASSMALNVNNTGAKTCLFKGANISGGIIVANGVYDFVYDGTNWQLLGGVVPTATSQLTNDSGFVTATYVDEAIANAITTTLNTSV